MKNEFIKLLTMTIVLGLIIVGCEKNSNPITPTSDFDTRLIGEWLFKDSWSASYPGPLNVYRGFQLMEDKTIKELGIEIRTGKVAILNNSRFIKLIKANEGILVIEYFAPPNLITDTLHYDVRQDELIISNGYSEKIYKRTKLGSQVTNPISFDFTAKIDSNYYTSIEVYSYPPSFVSRISETDLLITAFTEIYQIRIEINNFNGVGSYQIPYKKGMLIYDAGDYFLTDLSDSSNIGTISITNYNEIQNICTGTFSFDTKSYDYNYNFDIIIIHHKVEGYFSLPIYK